MTVQGLAAARLRVTILSSLALAAHLRGHIATFPVGKSAARQIAIVGPARA